MIKNQHLLGVIAGLAFVSTLVCLYLAFTERANSNGLVSLNDELESKSKRSQAAMDAEMLKLRDTLQQQAKEISDLKLELAAQRENLGGRYQKADKAINDVEKSVKTLTSKVWLVQSNNTITPWSPEIASLRRSVDEMKKTVQEMKKTVDETKKP